MRNSTKVKLMSLSPHEVEPDEDDTPTKSGAASVEVGKKPTLPHSNHPGRNLGKFLHPKHGSFHGRTMGADELNHTVDANTGGHVVRPTQ